MDQNELKQYLKDLKAAGQLSKEQEKLLQKLEQANKKVQKSTKDTSQAMADFNKGLDDVGEAFGLRLSQVFDTIEVEVEQAKRDIATMFDDLEATAPEIAASIGEEFNSSFRNALPDPKDIQAQINLNDIISQFKASFPEMGNEMQKAFKTGDIATFYKKFGDEGMKTLRNFLGDKKGFDGLKDYFKPGGAGQKDTTKFRQQLESFEPAAQKTTKVIANWGNLFRQIGNNILNYIGIGKIIKNLLDFDNKLSNIKREFQLPTASFGKASSAMSGLVKYGAQFGLDNEKSFKLVKDIGEYAKSTNIQNLAATAKQVAAVSDATGIALETVGQLTGQMMFFGASASRARGAFVDIQKSAARFGLNVTQVAKKFQDVFPRYARMGFKGGEESLAKMAAKAEKMGVDLNKALDMSDKFLDINSALEASADLSLLGGAASQVSFIDLMKAAQEGGDALIDITAKMTSDIGKLDKSGKLQLTLIDRQKMKAIAEATGQDIESLTNQRQSKLQDLAKQAAIPPGVFNSLSPEERDFLLSKTVNQGGKWQFEGLGGLQDLKGVTKGNIQAMMNKANSDAQNMEKAAKSRQSLEEKLTNLANEILAQFTAFQPYLEMLKHALDKLRAMFVRFGQVITSVFGPKYGSWVKTMLLLGGILMLTFGPTAMLKFAGILTKGIVAPFKLLGNLFPKLTSLFKGAGGGAGKLAEKVVPKPTSMPTPPSAPGGEGMRSFTKSLPNPAQILSVAAAIVALGLAMLMIGKGIQFAANGFANLVRAFNESKNAGMALAAIGVVMVGFIAMLYMMVGAVAALGAAGTAGAIGLLALGASLLMVGAGIYFAAKGFSILVNSFMQMGKYSGSLFRAAAGMVTMGGALALISPALIVFGAAGLIAAPAMIAFGYFLRGLGAAKGVNPKLISQIGNSMGSIAWGLTKLGFAAGPAALAMISGAALMVVAVALKNIATVDVKKIGQFGQSLTAISFSMIKGLIKLGAVAPFAVLAMVSAGSIWVISQALSRIKIIDLKKLQNFGDNMGLVGRKMLFGLIKLGAISPFVVLAVVSAGGINLISRMLGSVKIVDTKKIQAFGNSLGAVSLSMIWGLTKLGLVSPFVVLGVVSAGGINLISRMLRNVPLINTKTLKSNATALNSASGTYAKAFLKLLPVAVLTPTALLAAGGIWGVTRMLKSVPTLNSKSLKEAASVVSSIAWPFVKSFFKLQAVAALTPLALLAGIGILGVTKALSAVPKLNPSFLITTAGILSQVAGPFAKALFKLAFGAIGVFAVIGAMSIKKITDIFSGLKPLNTALLISVAVTLGAVSGTFGKSLLKLGLLGVFAGPAIFAAIAISKITQILSKLTPLNTKNLISTAAALSVSSTSFLKGLIKFGVLSVFAIPAILAAKSVSIVVNLLSKLPKINPAKLMLTGLALSLSANAFLKGLVKFGLLGVVAIPAIIAAFSILKVTRLLSQVPLLNPVKLITTANTLSRMAGPLAKGLAKIALTLPLTIPAFLASVGILGTTKMLSKIPFLNPAKLIITANTLNKISGPFLKGLLKIALTAPIGLTALIAATQILGVTKMLSLVPILNPVKLITTANTLNAISWPLFKGLLKIAGTAVTASLALVAAIGILGTTKMLAAVPFLNPAKLIITATTLAAISGPLSKGLLKIGLLAPFATLAYVSALSILAITKVLANLPVIPVIKIISLAGVLRGIGNLSGGLLALGLMSVFAVPALLGAIALRSVVKVLAGMPTISPIKIIFLAGTLRGIGNLSGGLVKLGMMSAFAIPALLGAMGLRSVVRILSTTPSLSPLKFLLISFSLNVIGTLAKGFVKLSLISPFVIPATIAAIGLRTVARLLSGVPLLMPAKFSFIALSLATSGSIAKGLIKLSLISPFVVPATIAAIGLRTVARLLAGVPLLMPAKFIFLALSLSASLQIAKGLIKLSVISPFIAPALVAAYGLRAVTRILAGVPMLLPNKFSFVALSLNASGAIVKGLIKLSAISAVAAPALVAAYALRAVTRILAGVPFLFPTKFLFIAASLNTSGAIAKGLAKLSIISAYAVPAMVAAIALRTVTRILSGASFLNPIKFAMIGITLNTTSLTIAKGLAKLSLITPLAIPALVAAKSLSLVTRVLATSAFLNPVKFSLIALTLNSTMGTIAKGLAKLSLITPIALPAIIAAKSLSMVTRILATSAFLNPIKFSFIALTLNNTSGPIAKGLAKLSVIAPLAFPAIVAAKAVNMVTKILASSPILIPAVFSLIAKTLDSYSLPIAKGLIKLSILGPFSIPAIAAAKAVRTISYILFAVLPLSMAKMSSIANVLSRTSGPIAKGLIKLAIVGPLSPLAIYAANNLLKISKTLAQVPFLSSKNLMSVANTMSSTTWSLLKALGKFASLSLVILPALGISAGLAKLSQNLSKVVMINPATLHMLSATLNSVSGKLFIGLGKFSASALLMVPAVIVASGLIAITKLLNSSVPINRAKIVNIGTTLFAVSPVLVKGLITFSRMGIYLVPAVAAALGVVSVTRILTRANYINSKKLLNIGDTLFYASPRLSRGFIIFSRAGFYAIQAIVAAKSLVMVTNALQLVKPISLKTLSNIGNVLSSTASNIVKGLRLLSPAVLFVLPAIIASRGLVTVSNLLSKVSFISQRNMYQLGFVTNNTGFNILKGLGKLSLMVPFLIPSIIAAAGLSRLSAIINKIQLVSSKNLTQLGSVINVTAFSLLKGLAKFTTITPFIIPSIYVAFGLVRLAKIINQIQPVFYKNLLQLGNVLNTTGFLLIKGLAKFSATTPFIIPSIFAAMGLVRFTKIVNQIQPIFYKNLLQLGNVLGARSMAIVKGLAKFSAISLFIVPSIISALGLVRFTKIINSIVPISYAKLFNVGFSLSSTTGSIIKGMVKFAAISFFVGPAIISAYGLRRLSKVLIGIINVPMTSILNLSNLLNAAGSSLIKGLMRWSLMTPFILPSVIVAIGINRIFKLLSAVANVNLIGLGKSAPILGTISTSLVKFSRLGLFAPLLVSAGFGLVALSKSLSKSFIGFLMFSIVPWGIISKAIPVLNSLMSSLIKFGFQGLAAAPGVIAMALAMRVLGKSLTGVASGFAVSTKSMSEYNKEKGKMATVQKPAVNKESLSLIQRQRVAAATGTEISSTRREETPSKFGRKEESKPQIVQIKPIQIDLKLNGRMLQQLLVEANYNRS